MSPPLVLNMGFYGNLGNGYKKLIIFKRHFELNLLFLGSFYRKNKLSL